MSHLVDTHVLLWLLAEPGRVPEEVRRRLADRSTELVVSAVSALEIATKVRLGRLPQGQMLVHGWSQWLERIGAVELAITSRHAVLAGTLSWDHRDPFDRILVAQASTEQHVLVTVDRAIAALPGVQLLTW